MQFQTFFCRKKRSATIIQMTFAFAFAKVRLELRLRLRLREGYKNCLRPIPSNLYITIRNMASRALKIARYQSNYESFVLVAKNRFGM